MHKCLLHPSTTRKFRAAWSCRRATTATVRVTTSCNKAIRSVSIRAHYAGVAKSALLSFLP